MPKTTFPLSGRINLSCRLSSGSLRIQAEDGCTEAVVRLTARHAGSDVVERTEVGLQGSTLIVHAPTNDRPGLGAVFGRGGHDDGIDIEVTVPAGTAMKLAAASATVQVHGRAGSVDARTGSSLLSLEQVDGEARLRSGSGEIAMQQVTGPTRVKSGSGSVQVGAANDDLDITNGSGNVVIGVPVGVQAKLDVQTGSGKLRSELPVADTADTSGAQRTSSIRARTGSGNVTVRRATVETDHLGTSAKALPAAQ